MTGGTGVQIPVVPFTPNISLPTDRNLTEDAERRVHAAGPDVQFRFICSDHSHYFLIRDPCQSQV